MLEQHIYKGGAGVNVRSIELPVFEKVRRPMVIFDAVPFKSEASGEAQCRALTTVVPQDEAPEDVIEGEFIEVKPLSQNVPEGLRELFTGSIIDIAA